MGDSVERALEETVSILQTAKRAKLLSSQEIDQVVRKRRNHEYALKKHNATRAEYLKYASFERELSNLLQKRADKKKIKKKTAQLIIGKTSSRVNLVYSRAVKAFRGDVDLWLHYARHCVKTGTIRTAQKVLARAIAYRGDCERVWLAAIALHFDTCGDAKGARTLAQRALRAIPHSSVLWKEYFRLEVCYLSKLIIRRLAIGLKPAPELPKSGKSPQQVEIEKDGSNLTSTLQQASTDPAETRRSGTDKNASAVHAEDSVGENRIADGNYKDDSSGSCESGASDEESAADTSDSSSDGESDDSEGVEQMERLSFWEGGVPMAVFKRACDGVNLTAEVLLDIWDITVSSPYVPHPLLKTMSTYITNRFPNRFISRLIKARLDWDCAKSEYHRERGGNSKRDSILNDQSLDTSTDSNRRITNAIAKLPSRLLEILSSKQISELSDSERNAVLACIRDVETALKRTSLSGKVADELNALRSLLDQKVIERHAVIPKQNGTNESAQLDPKSWSTATLEHAIAQGKTKHGDWEYGDVLSAVKQKAGIPFRDIYHDRVVSQFFANETDIKAIREVSDVLLATPPLTMEGLRCVIMAELRILGGSDAPSRSVLSEETKARLRSLFAKSEALSNARYDVEFWLLYLDFERRKAKDARAASVVHSKALRILAKEKAVLFTELYTLRNLT